MNALWLGIKILSDVMAAGNVVLGRYALTEKSISRQMLMTLVGLVTLPLALWGLAPSLRTDRLDESAIAWFTGFIYIVSGEFYYRALKEADSYMVSLALRATPLLTLAFSVPINGERLSTEQLLGFAMFVLVGPIALLVERHIRLGTAPSNQDKHVVQAGVVDAKAIVAVKEALSGTVNRRAMGWAFMSAAAGGLSLVLIGWLLERGYSGLDAFMITRPGVVVGTFVLVGWRNVWASLGGFWRIIRSWRDRSSRQQGALLVGEQLNRLVSLYLSTEATRLAGGPTLPTAVSSASPLYVWLISAVVKRQATRYERLDRIAVAGRAAYIGLLLFGTWLVA